MKNKTVILWVITVFILLVLTSCGNSVIDNSGTLTSIVNNEENVIVDYKIVYPDSYNAIPYGQFVGIGESSIGTGGQIDKKYDYEKVESYVKNGISVEPTTFNISGETFRLRYSETIKSTPIRTYDLDWYYAHYDGGNYSLFLNSKTGKIVRFTNSKAGQNRDYKSRVNPSSSDNDFLSYAKSILFECSGLSMNDWEYSIKTFINSTSFNKDDEGREFDGFINYYQNDSHYNADYTFTFFKTINTIKRADKVSIKINNTGEVLVLMAESYEDVFAPFEQAYINVPSLVSIEQSFEDQIRRTHNVTSINSDHKLIAMSNELFVEITVSYRYEVKDGENTNQLDGMERYLIKVAEYSTN